MSNQNNQNEAIYMLNSVKAELTRAIEKGAFADSTAAINFLTHVVKEIEVRKEN